MKLNRQPDPRRASLVNSAPAATPRAPSGSSSTASRPVACRPGKSMGDPYIWGMVAFLERLPQLDAAQYRALVAQSEGHQHGGGEPDMHDHSSQHSGHDAPAESPHHPVADEPDTTVQRNVHQHADGSQHRCGRWSADSSSTPGRGRSGRSCGDHAPRRKRRRSEFPRRLRRAVLHGAVVVAGDAIEGAAHAARLQFLENFSPAAAVPAPTPISRNWPIFSSRVMRSIRLSMNACLSSSAGDSAAMAACMKNPASRPNTGKSFHQRQLGFHRRGTGENRGGHRASRDGAWPGPAWGRSSIMAISSGLPGRAGAANVEPTTY
ncbi:hypothetical protein SSTU70S_06308 [Stutzerimonas stutzeri]